MTAIEFCLNGRRTAVDVEGDEVLLTTLRERLGVKSVKEGCSIGECGVCTVLIDDEPHYSCLTLAAKVDGRDVKTVEFLGDRHVLHPLQEAFISSGAVQCGYCTPGMLLSAYSLLLTNRDPDEWAVKEALSGNLCRCTGYVQIIEAVRKAAQVLQGANWSVRGGRSEDREAAIAKGEVERPGDSDAGSPAPSKREMLTRLAATPGTKIIAGGTDVLVKARKSGFSALGLDMTRVPGMDGISDEDGSVRIGAAATHGKIARDALVRAKAASLAVACGLVGSPQIRNMGTIGGNIVNASPAAESLAPLLIHDAALTVESAEGVREIAVERFITGPYRTAIGAGELVTSISVISLDGYREGYRRVAKRGALAISRLSVAWAIEEDGSRFGDVRLAIGSCTPMPFRARGAESFLRGKPRGDGVIDEAVRHIVGGIVEASGMRPSYGYKLPVLQGLLRKILRG